MSALAANYPLFVPTDARPFGSTAARSFAQAWSSDEWAVVDRAEKLVVDRLRHTSAVDLVVVLDELAGTRELADARIAIVHLAMSRVFRLTARLFPTNPWAGLGPAAAQRVKLGLVYSEHADHVLRERPDIKRRLIAEVERQRYTDPTRIAFDPTVHVEIATTVLEAARALVCMLALGNCAEARPFSPWLVVDLAEHFARGCLANLRAIAAVPGVEVSEDVLPREHRLDLDALARELEGADAMLARLPISDCLSDDE